MNPFRLIMMLLSPFISWMLMKVYECLFATKYPGSHHIPSTKKIFGGKGASPDDYLNEHGDFMFLHLNSLTDKKIKFYSQSDAVALEEVYALWVLLVHLCLWSLELVAFSISCTFTSCIAGKPTGLHKRQLYSAQTKPSGRKDVRTILYLHFSLQCCFTEDRASLWRL